MRTDALSASGPRASSWSGLRGFELNAENRAAPSVVLVRDSRSFTTATYIERALATLCNLKTIYVDQYPYFIGGFRRLPKVARTRAGKVLLERALGRDSAFA